MDTTLPAPFHQLLAGGHPHLLARSHPHPRAGSHHPLCARNYSHLLGQYARVHFWKQKHLCYFLETEATVLLKLRQNIPATQISTPIL